MQFGRYELQSDFARKYFAEGEAKGKVAGKAEGKAELLLHLLQHRGIAITDEDRERVLTCTDDADLEAWILRVLTADSREAVFGG